MIINVISASKGGGAELLVRELHKYNLGEGVASKTIYLSGSSSELSSGEEVIGTNPRRLSNIFNLRKIFKLLLLETDASLTVHSHLTWPFYYVALASIGLKNVKLVYTEHNTINKRREIPLFWLVERLIYSRYSKIICISGGVHDSLKKWVGPRLAVRLETIPNGSRIYRLSKRAALKTRKPRLVSVGSLTTKKNFATAIKAVVQLQDQIESYEIVGEGPERQRLEQLIHYEKVEKQVKLVGWSDEIEGYLGDADLQIIPSVWEGFGLVAVEGMSTGLPIIASNVSGLREVLGSNNPAVTLVDCPESSEAWVLALKEAIVNLESDDSQKLPMAARTQAEKFTLEAMAGRYLEVYRSLK